MLNENPDDETNPYVPPVETSRDGSDGLREKTTGLDLDEEDPLFTIWTQPRATIRAILETRPNYLVLPLGMLEGVVPFLSMAVQYQQGGFADAVVHCFLIGSVLGLIVLYLGGWLISWMGRRVRGVANAREIRTALVWGGVPIIATGLLVIALAILLGRESVRGETQGFTGNPNLVVMAIAGRFIGVGLIIWAAVLTLKCIGEAHRFSTLRAFGTLWLLALLFWTPFILAAFVRLWFLEANELDHSPL